ncbi:hypothetical protein RchiOBHm_Chr7g0189481 [Rosa chinensis]|uniref:Uncharacterized protein n=1 Tax=Rosa chinensis TaxID=74649 RepID=A0A2P6P4U2_ROSCH|nr:hypothetical protein RchiOBHm_Chr7g0189481 [Rosa chinensis]
MQEVLPQMEPTNRGTDPILVCSDFTRFQSLEIIKPTRILSCQLGLSSFFLFWQTRTIPALYVNR